MSFIAGVAIVGMYRVLEDFLKQRIMRVAQSAIESIISHYLSKLARHEADITLLHNKIDRIESILNTEGKSLSVRGTDTIMAKRAIGDIAEISQDHTLPVISHNHVYKNAVIGANTNKPTATYHNNVIEHILSRLSDGQATSREIQHMIGRTREHTARLLKKLYESNLVYRDLSKRPFLYNITDVGLKWLTDKQRQEH
jgi:hypothetical protein